MVPTSRRLPAALILEVSVISVRCRMAHDHWNTAMYFLLTALTLQLFYWLFYLLHWISVLGNTRWVLGVMTRAFFVAIASKRRALTPATQYYSFCRCHPSPRHVSAWLRMRGGGAIVAIFSYDRGRLHVFFLAQRNNNSKYLRKKHLRKKNNTS